MEGRRLIAAVFVKDPATREDLILLPGESPDPQIAALVTNPDAWDAPPDDVEPEPVEVAEPDSDEGRAGPDPGLSEAGGAGTRKQSRRSRTTPT